MCALVTRKPPAVGLIVTGDKDTIRNGSGTEAARGAEDQEWSAEKLRTDHV